MDSVNALVCVAAVAWAGQIALGWMQINRFNRALATLSDNGKVRIGRSAGRFKPRTVLALAVNDEGRISGNFVMKGLTVFSKPRTEARLNNTMLNDLCPGDIFPADKALREALMIAISNKR